MCPLDLFFVVAVTGFTIIAAISDLKTRRLPNWLTVSAFVAALLTHTVIDGLAGLGFSLFGFVTGFGILLILWLIGGSGGGDVKLMGALGAWLGAGLTVRVFLVSTALAATATIAMLLAGTLSQGFGFVRRNPANGSAARPTSQDGSGREAHPRKRQRRRLIPYAVPVALGTWLVLFLAWHSAALPWCGDRQLEMPIVSPKLDVRAEGHVLQPVRKHYGLQANPGVPPETSTCAACNLESSHLVMGQTTISPYADRPQRPVRSI